MHSIIIVGASLAGLSAARALRAGGFAGDLTVVGAEQHRPYDRPPLTKDYLRGSCSTADLALETDDDLDARWLLGAPATSLDARSRRVGLADGRTIAADGVVLATGADAVPHPLVPVGPTVHTLRTVTDAERLRADLGPGRRLVIVGAGFIGTEIAASAVALGADVTLLAQDAVPLRRQLGAPIGDFLAAEHRAHGVRVIAPTRVVDVDRDAGGTTATALRLADGTVLPADVVVVGIGSRAATGWLAGSGLRLAADGGVLCDATGRALHGRGGGAVAGARDEMEAGVAPGVVAVGDCAAWWDGYRGVHHRLEHWTGAVERAGVVADVLLAAPGRSARAPYFWSDQYDLRLQVAGVVAGHDELRIEEGGLADRSFLARYYRAGEPVAVLGVNQPKLFTRARRALGAGPTADPASRAAATTSNVVAGTGTALAS
ncbi:pyridine nucleotide-disulfide oxidoreductase [Tersicoccus solisilvae]|uniref:Pyridine nucleotide-disulfide oxidoreductase n=1 Tax=Tersicoccus solisilvae TaxID=1882339 RepID=A0ABQ1P1W0_9MICC|nr:FAD-dependent oxidoreductase [Tersicoccus solisilvae]GGC89442.1 pyridine nucleotide-disulfide oxidoreductase [Tersicoccus solisilvae]